MADGNFETYLHQCRKIDDGTEEIRHCREDLRKALHKLEGAVVPEDVTSIADVIDGFDAFSAEVSLIGQVKAGKTALTNALLGVNDLLPSDVNPWTSVVTSMHINCIPPDARYHELALLCEAHPEVRQRGMFSEIFVRVDFRHFWKIFGVLSFEILIF